MGGPLPVHMCTCMISYWIKFIRHRQHNALLGYIHTPSYSGKQHSPFDNGIGRGTGGCGRIMAHRVLYMYPVFQIEGCVTQLVLDQQL